MNRLFWIVAVLALVLAGCGGAADEGESEGEGGAAEVKSGPGFDGKTIKLGVLTPLSGPVAVIGQPLTAGNQVYFDYVNSKGGIAGKYK
ncbi:MAG: ABC transporter substrate-binding protein, partial [Thermoleophilia bacterium]